MDSREVGPAKHSVGSTGVIYILRAATLLATATFVEWIVAGAPLADCGQTLGWEGDDTSSPMR